MTQNHTEYTLMITPIDEEAVKKYIASVIPPEENTIYVVDIGGIVENVHLNKECCYGFFTNMFFDGKIQQVMEVPIRLKKYMGDNGYSTCITPEFYFPMPEDKLLSFALPKQSLFSFMGSRYRYNGRITNNMNEFLQNIGSHIPIDTSK